MSSEISDRLYRCGVVPVMVVDDAAQAVPLARAVLAGGIDVIEITFRTEAAAGAIAAIAAEVPEILVGAGTVLTPDQARQARQVGVRYMPLGGVSTKNVQDYLAEEIVLACGGSWIAKRDRIAAGDWAGITATAAEAKQAVQAVR